MSAARKIDFKELKERATFPVVLAHYGLSDRFALQEDGSLRGACPFKCEKQKGRSFKITADEKAWFNHDRACQCLPLNKATGQPVRGGNVLDFIMIKEGCEVREAGLLLDDLLKGKRAGNASSPEGANQAKPAAQAENASGEQGRNLTFEERGLKLIALDPSHEEITRLGLEPETVMALGAGYAERGMMRGRIAFPIKNVAGKVVAYVGRKASADIEGPEWLWPKDFHPDQEIVGLDELTLKVASGQLDTVSVLVITFDMLEAAYCRQVWPATSHQVLCLLSPSLSQVQKEGLRALSGEDGFTANILVVATGEGGGTASAPILDEAILFLSRLALTKCVVLSA